MKSILSAVTMLLVVAIPVQAQSQSMERARTASYSERSDTVENRSSARNRASARNSGIVIGAYGWQQNWQGELRRRNDSVRVDGELGFDDENEIGAVVYAKFDHSVAWLPRVKLQYSDIQIDNRSNARFDFGGRAYDTDSNAHADLSHGDATFFYSVLNQRLRLDLGLTVRAFNGEIVVEGSSTQQTLLGPVTATVKESADIDDVVPLLFAGVDLDTKIANIHVIADLNGGQLDNDKLVDFAAGLRVKTPFGLSVDGGYRRLDLDIEQNEDAADIQIDGVYLGLNWHF